MLSMLDATAVHCVPRLTAERTSIESMRRQHGATRASAAMRPCWFRLAVLRRALLLLPLLCASHSSAFQLRTSSTIDIDMETLQQFIATPTNWPEIVASSHSVRSVTNQVDRPLKIGESVEEVFGLPPILPLSVVWECVRMDDGYLEFNSKEGVPGLANDCKMIFRIREKGQAVTRVDLTMEFASLSPITPLGIPLLSLDNMLALNVLLPSAIRSKLR